MKEKEEKFIILTRMYAGKYLEENIGHEIINLIKDDNGSNYIYINPYGKINPQYNGKIHAVFLVRWIEKGVLEVLAKAEGLEQILYKTKIENEANQQIEFIKNNKIKYGKVPLDEIYGYNLEEKICITFKAEEVRKVKVPLYLIEDEDKKKTYKNYIFLPKKHFASTSLKMYYSNKKFPEDYKNLQKALKNDNLWCSPEETKELEIKSSKDKKLQPHDNFLSIIKKENDELVFSNILEYLFGQEKKLFVEFAKNILYVRDFSEKFSIYREKDNIDLLVEGEKDIIIIENKIKSKINGNQLSKYYNNVKKKYNKKLHCFLFCPDYNIINKDEYEDGDKYERINYSQVYKFYKENKKKIPNVRYIDEFIEGLGFHSQKNEDHNFEIMKSRFISKIKEIRRNKN